jgi:N utilization substance protein B
MSVFGGTRRDARERALHLLYEADQRDVPATDLLGTEASEPDEYTVWLVEGVTAERDEIDTTFMAHARGWTLARMPLMDRLLLEIATFELLSSDGVPTAVVLNEAVELANEYSTDDSGRFVNGVLATVADRVRGE